MTLGILSSFFPITYYTRILKIAIMIQGADKMNTILFDLDGTLLPMDVEEFTRQYFMLMMQTMNENKRDGKLILKAVLKGTEAMMLNDGKCTNEKLFWKVFCSTVNIEQKQIEPEFNLFYEQVFDQINTHQKNQAMIDAVGILKEKGYRLILATNPLFPAIATKKRIMWAGLDPHDFDVITTYENASFCKPNLDYYRELLQTCHLSHEQCMMVGNDVKEDGTIEKLEIPLYLVEDYMLNRDHLPIECRYHGKSTDFLEFVHTLPHII